jgi:small subunit ribosomal protein S20
VSIRVWEATENVSIAIVGGRPKPGNRRAGRINMANIASQQKRILRSERERTENRLLTSTVKTHFRRLEAAVEGGDAEAIATEQRDLVSKVDKAVQKGALHKNTGARKKSKAARIARTA